MVKPLLEITTSPARYEYEVQRAKLQISQKVPTVDRRVKRAELNMRRQAGKLDINSIQRRSDMGMKGVVDRANYEGDLGRKAALEATGNYAELGNQIGNIAHGGNIPDAMWSLTMKHSKGDLVLVPVSPIDMKYIPATLTTEYTAGEMHSNWNVNRPQLEFVPGSFRLNFSQYPSINIEYLGGPLYVPPSADPNFEVLA